MNKVIELLEKELERQGLLRMANKMEKQKKEDWGPRYKGPDLIPNSELFETEIEKAIKILKGQ